LLNKERFEMITETNEEYFTGTDEPVIFNPVVKPYFAIKETSTSFEDEERKETEFFTPN
jgi:hypothetical protein